jgi:hypothetical protein
MRTKNAASKTRFPLLRVMHARSTENDSTHVTHSFAINMRQRCSFDCSPLLAGFRALSPSNRRGIHNDATQTPGLPLLLIMTVPPSRREGGWSSRGRPKNRGPVTFDNSRNAAAWRTLAQPGTRGPGNRPPLTSNLSGPSARLPLRCWGKKANSARRYA